MRQDVPGAREQHARHGVMGQDGEILGPAAVSTGGNNTVPGARLLDGHPGPAPCHWYGGPVHQHSQSQQPILVLQDHAESAQVADKGGQLLHGRYRIRSGKHRRPLRHSVCGRQRL